MGMSNSRCLSNTVIGDSFLLWDIPDEWTIEQAASVPVVYGTVSLSLVNLLGSLSESAICSDIIHHIRTRKNPLVGHVTILYFPLKSFISRLVEQLNLHFAWCFMIPRDIPKKIPSNGYQNLGRKATFLKIFLKFSK